MSTAPLHLDGWDLDPRHHGWMGFGLHPAERAAFVATLWLADVVVAESRAAAWLDRLATLRGWHHPGVHPVHVGGVWEGRPWAITGPVRRSATWAVQTQAVRRASEVAAILRDALGGLAFAHTHGVTHGAIGPEALYLEGGVWRFAGLGLLDVLPRPPDPGSAERDLGDLARLVPALLGRGSAPGAQLAAVIAALAAGDAAAALDRLAEPPPTPPLPRVAVADEATTAGRSRIGRYTLLEQLARGGQGVVWRAYDPELDREVAVKVQHPAAMLPEQAVARFRQEARAAARLDHPAIVRVLDFGSAPEGLFYAMELVDGVDLHRRLREVGRLDPHRAARWVASIARGIAHAHREGIVHRDLKPANIILERGDQPRVTDFGLALAVDQDHRLSRDGDVMGTPSYMAPEQAAGRMDRVGPRSDIYSLGAVLYEMLTGRPPVRSGPMAAVAFDLVHKSPVPIRTLAPTTPLDLVHICARAMAPQPTERYSTMDAFAEDLERFLVGEPVSARAPSWAARTRAWVRRHRTATTVTASLVGALGVLGGIAAVETTRQAEAAARREANAARLAAAAETAIAADLKNGDLAGGHRIFADLVAQPELQRTRAWIEAWLDEAHRRAALGDDDGERDALGRVWLNADDAEVRRLALTRIAGSWRRHQRFDQVGKVLDALAHERGTARASSPEARLETEAALYRWQTEGIAHPAAPLVAALATRTVIDLNAEDVWLDAVVGGGQAILHESAGPQVWELAGDGTTRPLPPAPDGASLARFFRADDDPRLRAVATTAEAVLVLRLDEAWTEEARIALPGAELVDLVYLDGATPTIVAATQHKREVVLVERDHDGRWSPAAPIWPAAGLNSDFGGAAAADLDGDGTRELLVALGAWQAYDLRVLDRAGAGFRMRARERLGDLHTPRVLRVGGAPVIVVGSTANYRNLRIFGDEPPLQGIALVDLQADALRVLQRFDVAGGCEIVAAGDADGDHLDDVIARCGALTVVARQVAGSFAAAAVSGLDVRGAADLDGDGDLELVAREPTPGGARLVIAGATGPVRAPDPRPVLDLAPIPAGVGAADGERWRREEVLVGLGLNESALGWMAPAETDSPASLSRRARLEAGATQYEGAVTSALAALDAGAADGAALATDAALQAIDPEAARAVLASAPSVLSPALRTLAAAPRQRMEFTTDIDPHWRFVDPSALRHRRDEGALRVDVVGAPELARLPLVVQGGVLRLEVELDTEVVEWDSGLAFSLESPDGKVASIQLWIRGEGGGGSVATVGNVRYIGGQAERARLGVDRRVAAAPSRLHLTASMDGTNVRTRMEADGTVVLSTSTRPLGAPTLPVGRQDLVLRGWSDSSAAARLLGRVRRIVVDGATLAEPVPPSATDLAITGLVDGRADDALPLLGGATGEIADRARREALLDLGRAAEAATIYRRELSTSPELSADMLRPLRTRPHWAALAFQDAFGAAWLARAWEAWAAPMMQHPDDRDVSREFMSWADDLGLLAPGASDAAALTHADVTLYVADVARRQGRLTQAARLAALATQEVAGRGTGDDAVQRALLEARADVELARVALLQGNEPELRRQVEAALVAHPAPEALAELLATDSTFALCQASTWWAQLVDPYRRLGARARE